MFMHNLPIIFKMIADKNVRMYLKKADMMMEKDKLYSKTKVLKFWFHVLCKQKITYHNGMYYLSFVLPPLPSKAMFTYINSALDKENIFSSLAYSKKTSPVTICLTITKKCNYNCFYCSAKDKDKEDISTAEWKKIIFDLQQMNTPVIFFTGGEPLLHADIEELCTSVTDKSNLIILTTGEGLTLERAKRLKECGVFGLGISLTPYGKEEDISRRRNEKSYDNAVNAIKNSVKAGLFTSVISVVPKNRLNEKELFRFFQFVQTLGANEIILKDPVKTGGLLEYDDNEIYYFTDKDKKMLVDLQKKANKHFKNISFSTEFLFADQEMFGCSAGINHAAITSSGELTPCDFCPISFGNVIKEPLDKLWLNMQETIGIPSNNCLQMQLYGEQMENDIPLLKEKTYEIIAKYKNDIYPKLFRDMQKGVKK